MRSMALSGTAAKDAAGNSGWMDKFSVGEPARGRPSKLAAPGALRANSAAGFQP